MHKRKGFTLVELVVVVMILGILAAVAAPKLLNTSGTATDNGLLQTLAVVRDAIERYAAENNGSLPGDAGTDADFKADLTEYLRGNFPKCPVGPQKDDGVLVETDSGAVMEGVAAPNPNESWMYNNKTGVFIVNWDGTTKIDPTISYWEL